MTAESAAGQPDVLTLARILRPWGRRGEVAAEVLTDFPERLLSLKSAWLGDPRLPSGAPPQSIAIRTCRMHLGQAIFHFEGVEDITSAERLRGREVQVPLGERVALAAGRYYIQDLIGCAVWEAAPAGSSQEQPGSAGNAADSLQQALGLVREVQRCSETRTARSGIPEAWILVVQGPAGEILIPFAAEICTHIDIAARRIEVRLPEGLRELNR